MHHNLNRYRGFAKAFPPFSPLFDFFGGGFSTRLEPSPDMNR